MNKRTHNVKSSIVLTALLLGVIISFSACHSAKQVAYFQNITDSLNKVTYVQNATYDPATIKEGDILNIDITNIDVGTGGRITETTGENQEGVKENEGFMVDKAGFIEMPVYGRIKLAGLTLEQAKEKVRQSCLRFYKDPIVNIRLTNYMITILGQVSRPGRYVIDAEKINIIDALGMAGDLDIMGKRGNVMVIREENGKSEFTRLSLNSTDIFQSEYYYLQSGDKIYVEPLKAHARAGTTDQRSQTLLTISISLISIGLSAISLISRLNQ